MNCREIYFSKDIRFIINLANTKTKPIKKQIILISLVFILSHGYSQTFNFGIGAALNFTNIVVSDFPSDYLNSKFGFQFNAKLDYNFNDKIGIRFEPGYANRGFVSDYQGKISESYYYSLRDARFNLNYLVFPLLIKYSPINNLSISLGPEFSYLLSEKVKADNLRDNNRIKFADNEYDIGIIAGLSYQLFDKLEIGFTYNRGFIAVEEDITITDKYGSIIGTINSYNQGFAFSIAYMLK